MAIAISRASVEALTHTLLADSAAAERQSEAFQQLRAIFEQITEITGFNREAHYKSQVPAAQGTAISINQTVRCFHDERRTLLFLRAMVRAIRAKQEAHPGETIEVCYAGCGPYAPFCTLVAPLFEPAEVQFTLLEINALALVRARELVKHLDLSDYVRAFQQADAVIHQLGAKTPFHILFSETLDAALHRECFVPILLNLLPQLDPAVTLIPQNVILRACLVKRTAFAGGLSDIRDPGAAYEEREIGEVFKVVEDLAPYLAAREKPDAFPSRSFRILDIFDFNYLVVYTEVQVYQELWLSRGESLLTEPWLREIPKVVSGPELEFCYQLVPQVELQINGK